MKKMRKHNNWHIFLMIIFLILLNSYGISSDTFPLNKGHEDMITSGRNVTSSSSIPTISTSISSSSSNSNTIDDDLSRNVRPSVTYSTTNTTILNNNASIEVIGREGVGINITGYVLENDDADTSFTDVQTLFITCAFTIGCLLLALILGFSIRFCWRIYVRNRDAEAYDSALNKDESSAPLKGNLTLSADELKNAESQFSISGGAVGLAGGSDLDGGGSSPMLTYSGASSRTTNHASANGSIITMTLKNNHLIVETEERNDILENSRETTMKYSPSNHDGVFVVEVQQGVRRPQNYPTMTCSSPEEVSRSSSDHQRALVHHPPAEMLTDAEEDATTGGDTFTCIRSGTNTGLSQSDLSESSNYSYRYGNQQGYDLGHYGYPLYTGYSTDTPTAIPLEPIQSDPDKPKITAAIYKASPSPNQQNILRPTNSVDIPIDATKTTSKVATTNRRTSLGYEPLLLSDIQAKERFTTENNNALKEEDILQEEQTALGNGQLTEDEHKELTEKNNKNIKIINKDEDAVVPTVVPTSEKGPIIVTLKPNETTSDQNNAKIS